MANINFNAPSQSDGTVTPTSAIEFAWHMAMTQITKGSYEIVLPMNATEVIGLEGISIIAKRFSDLLKGPVSVFNDIASNHIRILPPPGFNQILSPANLVTKNSSANLASGNHEISLTDSKNSNSIETASRVPNPAKKAKDRIRKVARPPNAFILYRQHFHAQVKADNPHLHNNDISVIIGKKWNNELEAVKDKFKQMAEGIKQKHEADHPDYQYQPRKPSERKKRNTMLKAAKSNGKNTQVYELATNLSHPNLCQPSASSPATTTVQTVFSADSCSLAQNDQELITDDWEWDAADDLDPCLENTYEALVEACRENDRATAESAGPGTELLAKAIEDTINDASMSHEAITHGCDDNLSALASNDIYSVPWWSAFSFYNDAIVARQTTLDEEYGRSSAEFLGIINSSEMANTCAGSTMETTSHSAEERDQGSSNSFEMNDFVDTSKF